MDKIASNSKSIFAQRVGFSLSGSHIIIIIILYRTHQYDRCSTLELNNYKLSSRTNSVT